MIGTDTTGRCQVRIGTDHPCPRPAVTELLGVPFCERCANQQRAYFTIGEFMRSHEPTDGLVDPARGFLNEPLADALRRMRREFVADRRTPRRLTRTQGE